MKRIIGIVFVVLCVLRVQAVSVKSDTTTSVQSVETRVEAAFTKKLPYHLSVGIEENIAARVYETDKTAYFRRSSTTVWLGYAPIEYVKLEAGYALRLLGDKGWSDPNEFIRHRAFLSVAGKYKVGNWRLSLRERIEMNCRTDSVNRYETNPIALRLRHRFHVGYFIPGKPVQVFANVELINTLNRPTQYLNYYIKDEHFGQYLSDARFQIGTRWRINRRNTLSLSYRFDYNYDRDLNITKNKGNIELTRTHSFGHVITLGYDLNW